MTVFQARASGGEERLDKFRLTELAKETKGVPSNVLVGVLQIIPDTVATQQYQHTFKYILYVGA